MAPAMVPTIVGARAKCCAVNNTATQPALHFSSANSVVGEHAVNRGLRTLIRATIDLIDVKVISALKYCASFADTCEH